MDEIIWSRVGAVACLLVGGLLVLRGTYLVSKKAFMVAVGAGLLWVGWRLALIPC